MNVDEFKWKFRGRKVTLANCAGEVKPATPAQVLVLHKAIRDAGPSFVSARIEEALGFGRIVAELSQAEADKVLDAVERYGEEETVEVVTSGPHSDPVFITMAQRLDIDVFMDGYGLEYSDMSNRALGRVVDRSRLSYKQAKAIINEGKKIVKSRLTVTDN